MALQKAEQKEVVDDKIYLSLSKGQVVMDNGNGEKEFFSSVDGNLLGIHKKMRTFGNEIVARWYIDLKDGDDVYSICLPYNSGIFVSIVMSLANDADLRTTSVIKITPYERDGFTKVIVHDNGKKLEWVHVELPPIAKVTVGGKTVKDDTRRMEFICGLVNSINKKLNM